MAIATVTDRPTLPAPADLPAADVVIYDGECSFCFRNVTRIHHWDGKGRIAFIPLQDPSVAQEYPDLTSQQLLSQLYLIDRDGRRHGGAEAFQYLTRRLPKLWVLAPLLHLPFSLPLWKWLYTWVAHRRYLFGGKRCVDGSCRI